MIRRKITITVWDQLTEEEVKAMAEKQAKEDIEKICRKYKL